MIATYQELLSAGWTPGRVRQALKTGSLQRLIRGVYTDEPPADVAARVRAACRATGGTASFPSAAALLGFGDSPASIHLTVPHESPVRPAPGLVVHRSTRPISRREIDGIAVTTAYQTVFDLARWYRYADAVVAIDAALFQQVVTQGELIARLPLLRSLPHARRARRALADSRVGAQSPMETRTRLILVGNGVPEPELQHPIETGRGLLHVDLAWPDRKVCLEYDGRDAHDHDDAFAGDRVRWRALAAVGWDVHPVTAVDLRRPTALVREVAAALAA